jgi:hypothetical protein
MTSDDFAPRKRTVSDAARRSREAAKLVAPINEKIGAWQAESVRLSTSSQRMREAGRHDAGIVASIEALLGFVEEQGRHFEEMVAGVAADVASHSRVSDTRTAIGMVVQRLRDALPKV